MQKNTNRLREAERFPLSIDLKFLLPGRTEATGMLLDISETGLALLSETKAQEGDDIVVYPIGLGRLCGKVVRAFDGGMGVQFTLMKGQQEIIRERLSAVLGGAPYMRLREKRSSVRIQYNIETFAHIDGDESAFTCTIKDMSRTGCRLQSDIIPPIGANMKLGALRGQVVRHVKGGFAMEFERIAPMNREEQTAQRYSA